MKVFAVASELNLRTTVLAAASILLVQLGTGATAATSEGVPSCRVELLPRDAPSAWHSAASALQQALRAAPGPDRDCREVIIRATAEHASVEVTTLDGRRGVRLVSDASEVEPTVAAMIVTVSDEPSVVANAHPGQPVGRWYTLLVASVGARLTLPSTPAPTLALQVAVARTWLELGLYGAWSPAVVGDAASEQAPFSSTAELGISAAYRRPVRVGALLFGTRLAGIRMLLTDNFTGTTQMTNTTDGTAPYFAPAMSFFAGAAILLFSHLRLRPEISAQYIAPIGTAASGSIPSLWSLGVSLGAESRVP